MLDEILNSISAGLRIDRFLKSHPEIDKRLPDVLEGIMADSTDKFGNPPETPAEVLLAYKQAIGDVMFNALASNPSLQAMAEQHFTDVQKHRLEDIIDILMDEIFKDEDSPPEDVPNREDVILYLCNMEAMSK